MIDEKSSKVFKTEIHLKPWICIDDMRVIRIFNLFEYDFVQNFKNVDNLYSFYKN